MDCRSTCENVNSTFPMDTVVCAVRKRAHHMSFLVFASYGVDLRRKLEYRVGLPAPFYGRWWC